MKRKKDYLNKVQDCENTPRPHYPFGSVSETQSNQQDSAGEKDVYLHDQAARVILVAVTVRFSRLNVPAPWSVLYPNAYTIRSPSEASVTCPVPE